jgi:hypothetical protein
MTILDLIDKLRVIVHDRGNLPVVVEREGMPGEDDYLVEATRDDFVVLRNVGWRDEDGDWRLPNQEKWRHAGQTVLAVGRRPGKEE